jgi:hypothetical protein
MTAEVKESAVIWWRDNGGGEAPDTTGSGETGGGTRLDDLPVELSWRWAALHEGRQVRALQGRGRERLGGVVVRRAGWLTVEAAAPDHSL